MSRLFQANRDSLYVGKVILPKEFIVTYIMDHEKPIHKGLYVNQEVLRSILFTPCNQKAVDVCYHAPEYPITDLSIDKISLNECMVTEALALQDVLKAFSYPEFMTQRDLKNIYSILQSKDTLDLLRYRNFSEQYIDKLIEYGEIGHRPTLKERAITKSMILKRF